MTREANTENYSNQSDTLLQCCSYLTFGLNGKGCGSRLAETKIINDDQTTVLSQQTYSFDDEVAALNKCF